MYIYIYTYNKRLEACLQAGPSSGGEGYLMEGGVRLRPPRKTKSLLPCLLHPRKRMLPMELLGAPKACLPQCSDPEERLSSRCQCA